MTVGMYGGKFLPLHMGHVYSITKAACMVDELYVVLSYSETRDKKLTESKPIKEIPYQMRLRWLSQVTKDMENVKVIAVEDTAESDETYDWQQGADDIRRTIMKPIDVVFGSEKSYKKIFEKLYPEATYEMIDSGRKQYPISATQIRNDGPFKHWDFIPNEVKPYFVKTVAIVGTESCGKSTLTRYLAKLYNTTYVEEYGRAVCDELGGCDGILLESDYYKIAYGHKLKEEEAKEKANKVTFIDSEAVVTQYYSDLYLGKKNDVVEEVIGTQKYDLYLFMEPDVKWVDDGLRIHGEQRLREKNNQKLKRMFQERGIQVEFISGNYHERLEKAIEKIEGILKYEKKKEVLYAK